MAEPVKCAALGCGREFEDYGALMDHRRAMEDAVDPESFYAHFPPYPHTPETWAEERANPPRWRGEV